MTTRVNVKYASSNKTSDLTDFTYYHGITLTTPNSHSIFKWLKSIFFMSGLAGIGNLLADKTVPPLLSLQLLVGLSRKDWGVLLIWKRAEISSIFPFFDTGIMAF